MSAQGHAKYVYIGESEHSGYRTYRWECSACGKRGRLVPSKDHAEDLGQRHADKYKGPKGLRDLLKFD